MCPHNMSLLLIFIIETQCVVRDLEYETEEIVWNRNMTIEHDRIQIFKFQIARRLRYLEYDRL